ncbi:MAG: hypothetical protein IT240_01815 [Bacteroidia bacterium]|jgi:hypothetical protein|nr:hypothetical protein [Bacteroidia bacterium]MCC6767755.1 hypothetical protein [Bacteroidia bacterium]
MKRSLIILSFAGLLSLLTILGCGGNQEGQILGTWTMTRMDALPGEKPYYQWEFTEEGDLLRYQVTDVTDTLLSVGRWGFNKRNRLNITKFDVGFNGEWEVVTLRNDVLRMVLKVEVDNHPAGQVLVEFVRKR